MISVPSNGLSFRNEQPILGGPKMSIAPNDAFDCRCCGDTHSVDDGSYDDQMAGLVCEPCRKDFIKVTAWLKHAGMGRPICRDDVNQHNYKRFQ